MVEMVESGPRPKISDAVHESLRQDEELRMGSERGFGVVFTVVFAVVGLFPLFSSATPRWWALIIAAVILAVALLRPALLRPLNAVWFRFGLLLHKITNPLIMGLIFFLAVTPTALVMRLMRRDPLHRRFDPDASSYWIERDPPGPTPETMKWQF